MELQNLTLAIDHYACFGCLACEVACKQENGPDYGIKLIELREDGPRMMNGRLDFIYLVNACLHSDCEGTPCVDSCPVSIITVRDDGIVIMDSEECISCMVCVPECPYDAIRINPRAALTEKLHLCPHRVDQGLVPACADNVCLAHCIYFGESASVSKEIEAARSRRTGESA